MADAVSQIVRILIEHTGQIAGAHLFEQLIVSKSALIQSYGDYVLHRKTCAVIKEIFKEHHDGAYSHYGDNAGEYRHLEACRNIVYKPFEQDAERDEQAGFQHCAEEGAGGIGQQPDFYLSLLLFPCPPRFGRDFVAQNFRLFDFHTHFSDVKILCRPL